MSHDDFRFEGRLASLLRPAVDVDELPDWAEDLFYDPPEGWAEKVQPFETGGHCIGGYPTFTQWDPRGVYDDFAGHTTLLFQLDSDQAEGIDIMWGDMGVGHFFVEPERLAALDFSSVLYDYDCS